MKTFDTVEQIAAEPDMHERYTYLANKYAVKLQWHEARGIFNEFYYTNTNNGYLINSPEINRTQYTPYATHAHNTS